MACVTADGSLTESGETMLKAIGDGLTDEALAQQTGFPLYRVRSGLREMMGAGLVELVEGKYRRSSVTTGGE